MTTASARPDAVARINPAHRSTTLNQIPFGDQVQSFHEPRQHGVIQIHFDRSQPTAGSRANLVDELYELRGFIDGLLQDLGGRHVRTGQSGEFVKLPGKILESIQQYGHAVNKQFELFQFDAFENATHILIQRGDFKFKFGVKFLLFGKRHPGQFHRGIGQLPVLQLQQTLD